MSLVRIGVDERRRLPHQGRRPRTEHRSISRYSILLSSIDVDELFRMVCGSVKKAMEDVAM